MPTVARIREGMTLDFRTEATPSSDEVSKFAQFVGPRLGFRWSVQNVSYELANVSAITNSFIIQLELNGNVIETVPSTAVAITAGDIHRDSFTIPLPLEMFPGDVAGIRVRYLPDNVDPIITRFRYFVDGDVYR